jgi:hypothetical protein
VCNRGLSKCAWKCTVLPDGAQSLAGDDVACFAISTSQGILEEFVSKTSHHTQPIVVTFTPKVARQYQALLRIEAKDLFAPLVVKLSGTGSLDQQHQVKSAVF